MSQETPPFLLGVGARDGERLGNMQEALRRLAAAGLAIRAVSSVYETEPVGLAGDRTLLNGVAVIGSALAPADVMQALLRIESGMGRARTAGAPDPGYRPIDLDILLFGDQVVQSAGLVIPHPRMQARRFVLEPLAEVAPDAVHPVLARTARQLLAECPDRARVWRHAPAEAWWPAAR